MKIINVNKKYDGKKLNNLLFDSFDGLTNNTFNKALRKKDIRINNIRVSENVIVNEGDEVKIFIIDELLYKNNSSIKIEIVYEDDNIVIFNKPINMEVTGDENSLEKYAKKFYNNSFVEPCHRLDRNTFGLVVFAKNEETLRILLDKFKNHQVIKHYRCIVSGIPKIDKQTLESYLFKDNKKSLVYISDSQKQGYRKIVTSYNVLKKDKVSNISLLDVELHTGRTHQIRAHLAHIGHPILGDGKYGKNEINKLFKVKTQQLCSYSLEFKFDNKDDQLSYLEGLNIVLENAKFEIEV